MNNLFQWGKFIGASGRELDWKIECDALSDEDWACIAQVLGPKLPPFSGLTYVPTGGAKLMTRLMDFATVRLDTLLVVDDVWTTGSSMRKVGENYAGRDWIGAVAFARGPLPDNVFAFARIG
ncbi:hypothetical protein [Hyphomicrobium sp.]|uniref:hypothetical protein n=1 Tax=Hyphomicrobium sp. TaxID=82 RepID=UPI001DD2949E|nr:hypothetical protein [Hyphomicrobium sp.]MBY0559924.1 hypothetical protein [Hyphomicrobium sp.]